MLRTPRLTLLALAALVGTVPVEAALAQADARRTATSAPAPPSRTAASRAAPSAAPGPQVRVLSETPTELTLEVTARWSEPLGNALRRAEADPNADPLSLASEGWATVSHPIRLGARVPPAVAVLQAQTETARLAGDAASDAFEGAAADVVAVGEYRRQTVGTLRVRMVRVEGGRVIRLRRAVVRVRRTAPPAPGAASKSGGGSSHLAVTRSALADGRWFKLPVTQSGVYRVTAATLSGLGLDPATIDPDRVAVFHNGGLPLPEVTAAPRPADLVETPTLVLGGGDGAFAEGDAVVLYAQGPAGWVWDEGFADDPDDDEWRHVLNPFTTASAVFLRVDAPAARRVGAAGFPGWTDAAPLSTVDARLFAERDLVNLEREGSGSGLDWLGQEITNGATGVTVLDTALTAVAGPARYRSRVAADASPPLTIEFGVAGATVATARPPTSTSGSATGRLARTRTARFETPQGTPLALTVRAPAASTTDRAWLDWAEAVVPRAPRADGGVLAFGLPGREGRFELALDGFAGTPEVWDVTEPGAVRRIGVQAAGGAYRVQVEVDSTAREFVAFDPGGQRVRTLGGGAPVANQNLHGLAGDPDYLVVAPAAFVPAAERLAAARQAEGLRPAVVTVEQVHNEFGGGVSDMRAIRDFAKFLYDRAPEGRLPRYLLLFGDGHYDFRGIEPNSPPNWVPTYQTVESLNRESSFTSDDYFGLLGDDEGEWEWRGSGAISDERVDLGVGRIPVGSLAEAEAYVDKLLRYDDDRGPWRTRMTVVADDQEPNSWDTDLHVQNAEAVAARAKAIDPAVTMQKVYPISYPVINTAEGRRQPGANDDILRGLNEGVLLWNYSGHGGPGALADERIFTPDLVAALDNEDRMPVFITATCSFGKYDMVGKRSLAEDVMLRPEGGAIAMLTTVRVVLTGTSTTSYNLGVNLALVNAMLARDAEGLPRRLGDALLETKNTAVGAQGNNRKFNLLGDPAMRLGLPDGGVRITEVNGVALQDGAPPPALRAFDVATVRGEVLTPGGALDGAFSGTADLTVFDAARTVELPLARNTDGEYAIQTDRIFGGRASVEAGRFSVRFVVPQDVSYSGLPARIAAYAATPDGRDAAGQSEGAVVAQDAGTRPDDALGPDIRLFLDDTTFVSGGLVRPEATLIARLRDPNGINTVGAGVGQELLLVLDGDEAEAIDLGRFYQSDLDAYQSGVVRYALPALAPGAHTLALTAYDAAGNGSTASLSFVVAESAEIEIRNAYPYPNPTPGPSTFFFEHNQPPGANARVQLRIYSLAGRPVRTIEREGPLGGGLVRMDWDGLDDDLDRLGSGIYLYRLRVEVDDADGATRVAERVDRLAVIR